MAAGAVTVTSLAFDKFTAIPSGVSIDTTDGAYITIPHDTEKVLITVTGTASGGGTITLKAGDSYGAKPDVALTLAATGTKYLVVESSGYLITKGANAGKIKFTSTAAANLIAVKLP